MPLDLDGLERDAYERGRRDSLLESVTEVAKITGSMKMGDFNDATWKMVCDINALLLKWASDAAANCDNSATV